MEEPKPANVVEALLCVMRALPAIGKDQKASAAQGGYAYRGIEAITSHTQSLFGQYGVLFVPRVVKWEIRDIVVNGKPWTDTIEEVEYTVYGPGGAEDRITVGPILAIGRDNADKGGNKCLTQAFKYALIQALCISDAKDDADHGSPEADARAAAPPAPPEDVRGDAWRRTREALERGVPKEVARAITKALGADVTTSDGAVAVAIAVESFERTGELPAGAGPTQEAPGEDEGTPATTPLYDRLRAAYVDLEDETRKALLLHVAELVLEHAWTDDDVRSILGSRKRDVSKALLSIPIEDLRIAVEQLQTTSDQKVTS